MSQCQQQPVQQVGQSSFKHWQNDFIQRYKLFAQQADESQLMAFNQLGQEMHQAGIPPEIAVEAYALAKEKYKDLANLAEEEAVLPLLEVIMTYGMNYRQQIQWQKDNSNTQFFQVLEASKHLICITDLQQQVFYTNPAFNAVFGQVKSKQNVPLSQYLHADPDFLNQICQSIEKAKIWQGALNINDQSNKCIRLNINAFPVGLSGRKLSHYVFMAEDISEKVIMQKRFQQSQRLSCLGELASGIAHEFNNVMLIVLGFAELIRSESNPAVRNDYVNEIIAAIDKGKTLNSQIMSFASDRESATEPQDLKQLFSNIDGFITTAVGGKISLKVAVPADVKVKLSEQHLCQMLTNLCINARHAIEHRQQDEPALVGEICLTCQLGDSFPWLLVSVKDNGCGMDDELVKQLFEPFFTTKDVGQGTGLGLSLLQKLVHQYEGEVQVESQVQKGTEFKLFLPVLFNQAQPEDSHPLPRQLLNHWLQVENETEKRR